MPQAGARGSARDTSIATYRSRRDFAATPEPAPRSPAGKAEAAIFVVQKHDATRLHYDFRLEHGGVLWSWAVPKGPSLDPSDKRLAVRTEDHPIEYADFAGVIPAGHYGAGTVEIWDRGTWEPQELPDPDPARALEKGELKIVLHGTRLSGGFVLVRLKPRPKDRAENWLLIKEHDEAETKGGDAGVLEREIPPPTPKRKPGVWLSKGREEPAPAKAARTRKTVIAGLDPAIQEAMPRTSGLDAPIKSGHGGGGEASAASAPISGAVKRAMPDAIAPQLATAVEEPPKTGAWLSEVKFDGYRLLAFKEDDAVRLLTRNGHDWTKRMPTLARSVARLKVERAVLDGELVALREDGVSSFALLQQALSEGNDRNLFLYAFDLLHLGGWDLSDCRLADRKSVLAGLSDWRGALRFSDHFEGVLDTIREQACGMGLEGIICKQADAPYRSGRSKSWLKLKCQGREEFIVLGFTPPAGSRTGLGALHVGYRDPEGALQYAGGVGTGFTDTELAALRQRLDAIVAGPPSGMVYADEAPDRQIVWVRPELVVEVRFPGWSGAGRVRHATYLGLREDKPAAEVVRDVVDPAAKRVAFEGRRTRSAVVRIDPPARKPAAAKRPARTAAPARVRAGEVIGDVSITHADRELWPGVTKRDFAEYWLAVAPQALREIAGRPLALVRCPEGIAGEHFFQKHAKPGFPQQIRAGKVGNSPYLVVDDVAGLLACAQVSAIELHAWGSREPDAAHADRVVFDLDPGDDVAFAEVVRAAYEVRERLQQAGFAAFCRTTGGKGLHVVAPVQPRADWDATRAWCRAFAEAMAADSPERFVSRLAKVERRGKILVDWLRNGLGSTAVASLSPRARPGATVATQLDWREVTDKLDPASFTIASVPQRLSKQGGDPWNGFEDAARPIPEVAANKRRR